MQIQALKREDISMVCATVVGGPSFEKVITEALDQAELNCNLLYVRYKEGFLQRLEVDPVYANDPFFEARIMSDQFWIDSSQGDS